MTAFIVIGAIAAVVGAVLLGVGIVHHSEGQPKHTAMLIGGMMLTAFGLILAGFAIAYQRAAPLVLNTAEARP
jgi:hypothetical protein